MAHHHRFRGMPLSLLIVVSSLLGSLSSAFVGSTSVRPGIRERLTHKTTIPIDQRPGLPRSIDIRGGGGTSAGSMVGVAEEMLTSALQSGHWGIPGLWGVASAVVLPLTMYRQGYSFSVGYGFSVFAMGCALYKVFGPSSLVLSVLFYGFRLGSFLLLRQILSKTKAEQMKTFDKSPRLKRLPLAGSVALFYAFMVTPVLYAARAGMPSESKVLLAGTILSWTGAAMEAIADLHKLIRKQRSSSESSTNFVGPTSGLYRLTRHPNYTGEVVFWLGLLISGVPFLGKSIEGWLCSGLGFYGIFGIMTNATKRLDQRQKDNYGGEAKFDAWRSSVKAPLFPFVNTE